MIDHDILQQARQLNMSQNKPYVCKYCNKSFAKETTLMTHMCEPKRRWQQEKEVPVQIAFSAFNTFYQMNSNGKPKNYSDFAKSPYYNAFVKFGRHVHSIRAVNIPRFIDFLLKNNIKLDHWCKDQHYQKYLESYLRTENVQDALERSIKTMAEWAEESGAQWNHYFLYASANRVVRDITNGRVSPWVVYNSTSGVEFLNKCTPEQVDLMYNLIDPEHWNRRFKTYSSDRTFAKDTLSTAGL